MSGDTARSPDPAAGPRVWFLLVGRMPLTVIDVAATPEVGDHLAAAGFDEVSRLYDQEVDRTPPRVGWTLKPDQVELDDDEGDPVLRLSREQVDATWAERAVEMRGTLTYVARGVEADATAGTREVCDAVDAAAQGGRVLASIVGVAEEQPTLPILPMG